MNQFSIFTLKALRKLYLKVFRVQLLPRPTCVKDPYEASQIIYKALVSNKPCMIARFGANELNTLVNYNGITTNSKSIYKFIKGDQFDWWWNDGIVKCLYENAGFFPPTADKIEQFCELMLQDIPEVDVLGSWLHDEQLFEKELQAKKVHLKQLEPFYVKEPWSRVLKGKKVLVVHPFAETIKSQYKRRELIFDNEDVLPQFDLKVIKAVQSIAGEKTKFNDWFEALEFMKSEIDKIDYDFCLIGAGAYGFPLAAHVKRQGKKAIHLGGVLQVLFGIKGSRFDDLFSDFYNQYWVKPSEDEKPQNAHTVENGCYW